MTSTSTARVLVVGLGHHGLQLARQVVTRGYRLVGAVETNATVGAYLASLLEGAEKGAKVHGSISEALGSEPDLAILAAAVPPPMVVDLARELMTAGVNVLTLSAEHFDTAQEWCPELDALGRTTGATLLSTGVQDAWWVHMPALAAGSSSDITRVRIEHVVDINTLAPPVGQAMGVGTPAPVAHVPEQRTYEPGEPGLILGAALQELARKLGLANDVTTVSTAPVMCTAAVWWQGGGRTVQPGEVVGIEERSTVLTEGGIVLEGILRTVVLGADEAPRDRVTIEGSPSLVLEHPSFPGEQITNVAVMNRIDDVLAAPGGVLAAGQLAPPTRARLRS